MLFIIISSNYFILFNEQTKHLSIQTEILIEPVSIQND